MSKVRSQPGNGNIFSNTRGLLRFALKGVILALAVGTGVFLLSVREDTWERVARIRPGHLAIMLAMVSVAWVCNGVRTWILARALGHKLRFHQGLATTLSMEFAIAATPGGVGGFAARLGIQRRMGIPMSTTATMMAADFTADLLFFGTLAPFALAILIKGTIGQLLERYLDVHVLLPTLAIPLGAAFVALMVLVNPVFNRKFALMLGRVRWLRRLRPGARLRQVRQHTFSGPESVWGKTRYLWRYRKGAFLLSLAVASIQWICRYGVLPMALWALGAQVNPLPLMLLQGVIFMLGLVVVLPGGGGTVEIVSSILLPAFAPASIIGVAVLIWRVFTYHLYVLAGGLAFWLVLHKPHWFFPTRGTSTDLPRDAKTIRAT